MEPVDRDKLAYLANQRVPPKLAVLTGSETVLDRMGRVESPLFPRGNPQAPLPYRIGDMKSSISCRDSQNKS